MLASQLASTCMSLLAIQILTWKSATFVKLSFAYIIGAYFTFGRHQNQFVLMSEQNTFSNIVPTFYSINKNSSNFMYMYYDFYRRGTKRGAKALATPPQPTKKIRVTTPQQKATSPAAKMTTPVSLSPAKSPVARRG